MKTLRNKIAQIATAVVIGMGSVMVSAPATAQNIQISYNDFYQELAPYGYWFNDPMYGYVWQPNNVGYGFRPYYTNGYWAMTEYGNMWISNYQWGWATFHYGRWALTNYGWVWVPGTEWAPAWVDWRQGNGYYGWAPMAPGININIYFGAGYNTPYDWFTFVPYGNIYNRNFNYYTPPRSIRNFNNFNRITNTHRGPRNNNMYAYGPRANEIRQHTKREVPVYNVRQANTQNGPRVSGNTVAVYQPRVSGSTTAAPRDVRSVDANTNTRATNVNQGTNRINNEQATRSTDNSRTRTQTQGNNSDNNTRVSPTNRNSQLVETPNTQSNSRAAQDQQRAVQEQQRRAQEQQRAAQEQQRRAQEQQRRAQEQQRAAQEQQRAQAERTRSLQNVDRNSNNRTMNTSTEVNQGGSQRATGGQSRATNRR